MYPAIKYGKCRNNKKTLVDTWQDDSPAVGSLLQVLEQEAVGGGPHRVAVVAHVVHQLLLVNTFHNHVL